MNRKVEEWEMDELEGGEWKVGEQKGGGMGNG